MRKVEINSHQYYAKGIFHTWTKNTEGKVFAIIELEDGNVKSFDVEVYQIKFID